MNLYYIACKHVFSLRYNGVRILALLSVCFFLGVSVTPLYVYASETNGTINTGDARAKFIDGHGKINFLTTNGDTVTVTDTEISGTVWGENVGWINLQPANAGVTNDAEGNLDGYAWGENTGWINFNTTNEQVTIDDDGVFNGYAWSENYGWISFNCTEENECSTDSYKLSTDWRPKSVRDSGGGISGGGGGGGSSGDGETPPPEEPSDNSPTITLLGDNPLAIQQGDSFTEPGYLANDPEDGSLVGNVQITGSVDTSTPGTYTLRYDVTDTDGNSASPAFRQVVVNESVIGTKPTITLQGANLIQLDIGDTYTELGASAQDFEDGDLTNQIQITGTVDTDTDGVYTRTYTVTDSDGNSTSVERQVVVGDAEIPDDTEPPLDNEEDGTDENVYPDFNVSEDSSPREVAEESLRYVRDTTKAVIRDVETFYNSPEGSITTKAVSTAGLVSGGAGAVTTLFLSPVSLSEIVLIPFRLWALLLSFLGLRKKYRPWGTVYDSITKQPLDPAYVVLEDLEGNELETSITDLDGRYGFLVDPGTYRIKAHKTNYLFPSKRLSGEDSDDLYANLYFGDVIDVTKKGGVVAKNIPMDPEKFDWNEFAKKDKNLMKFYSRFDVIKGKAVRWLFYIGFIVATGALFIAPEPYNYAIFALYLVVVVMSFVGLKRKKAGRIVDAETGQPLSFAIVRLFSPNLGKEIMKTVCDKYGRYLILISSGEYYVVIERKEGEDEYETVYTSEPFTVKKGIIKKTFSV